INTGEAATELRMKSAHTPFAQASVLWTIGAVHAVGHIVRRRLPAPGRRRSISDALATGQLVLANDGVLQEGPLVFALFCLPFLRFRRQWRNLPIGRIDDHARAAAGRSLRSEH